MTAATLRPPSGDVLRKGAGYYANGRVRIDKAGTNPATGAVAALVRGSREDSYFVYHGDDGWRCNHPHWAGGSCAHIVAVAAWLDDAEGAGPWGPVVAEAMGVAPTGQPTEPEESR